MSDLEISLLHVFKIVSHGELPGPIVFTLCMVLGAVALRILFGFPLAAILRHICGLLSHLRKSKEANHGSS